MVLGVEGSNPFIHPKKGLRPGVSVLFYFMHNDCFPMKYRRLTRQELEPLHEDFALFLAANGIDKKSWDEIKSTDPERAEGILDLFSDFVFEQTLPNIKFLEQLAPQRLAFYAFAEGEVQGIFVVAKNPKLDLTKISWAEIPERFKNEDAEIYAGTRKLSGTHEHEVFALMQQGALPSDGKGFEALKNIVFKV